MIGAAGGAMGGDGEHPVALSPSNGTVIQAVHIYFQSRDRGAGRDALGEWADDASCLVRASTPVGPVPYICCCVDFIQDGTLNFFDISAFLAQNERNFMYLYG